VSTGRLRSSERKGRLYYSSGVVFAVNQTTPNCSSGEISLGSGVVEMTVKQTGAQYSGNLLVTGAPTNPTGPTQGTVSGNEVRVIQPGNFTGGLTVQGDTMKGNVNGVVDANVTLNRQK
jgi:hypothetical protein